MIEVQDLSLRYSSGKGVFGLSFLVGQGEVVGYLGPNGAGKTTTIRQLMGFMKPDSGRAAIAGMDCFAEAAKIQRRLGYIPGEIAFVEGMQGEEYLRYLAKVRGLKDSRRQKELCDMFEFTPRGGIKKFSKGMKQKLGIVAAFMHQPEVLVLDEPTSGLDPLMQSRFVELILEEKKRGCTILMSSHMFEEIERTSDRVLIIKEGRLVAQDSMQALKNAQRKLFLLQTPQPAQAMEVLAELGFQVKPLPGGVEVAFTGGQTDSFAKALGRFPVADIETKTGSLEDVFMHIYAKEGR